MAKKIMIQGTSSNVGKSILTAGLCRIFHDMGYRTAPFKAQNMALNSYVTEDGGEIGRATAVQAEAAGVAPTIDMNPILLKPTGNSSSQVIVHGKAVGNMSAREYHQRYGPQAFDRVTESLERLDKEFEVIVIEGAGSPAEVNLKANDIVNMRVARYAQCPVLLVTDIDRGGALASVVGTLELLEPEERELVAGIIINKFRGDITLLQPALDFLEKKTGKPIVGVIPHLGNHGIEEEDSVVLDEQHKNQEGDLDIVVLRTPRISNFTDFLALSLEPGVKVRYVEKADDLGKPDLILLPGSKNTIEDLLYLRQSGLEAKTIALHQQGTPIMGICGGYQMLGEKIYDPYKVESEREEVSGFGLLPITTTFAEEKVTRQVTGRCINQSFLGQIFNFENLSGYEIHAGETKFLSDVKASFELFLDKVDFYPDGAVNPEGTVMGTYLHGVFDHDGYRQAILKALRMKKGETENKTDGVSFLNRKEENYRNLARTISENIDASLIKKLLKLN